MSQSQSQGSQSQSPLQSQLFNIDRLVNRAGELNDAQNEAYNCMVNLPEPQNSFTEELEPVENASLFNRIVSDLHGTANMKTLYGFYPSEVLEIWEIIKRTVLHSEKRGQKPKIKPLYRLLLVLSHVKHAQLFDKFGLDFGVKQATANTTFHSMLKILEVPL
jgi:hypothetical protein